MFPAKVPVWTLTLAAEVEVSVPPIPGSGLLLLRAVIVWLLPPRLKVPPFTLKLTPE
jgi:hypothetical protein